VTTKLWFSNFGENALKSLEESLKKLQLDYIDLILLHTPGIPKEIDGSIDQSKNKDLRKSAWKALENFHKEGKVKSLGISK
jgi:2,5-diketo-D-gluconate reductase A